MAINRSLIIARKAPYFFAGSLAVALLQFFWLQPVPAIILTAAISGSVVILVRCFASRMGNEDMSTLTLLIMLLPGFFVRGKLPHWGFLMYMSVFFLVVSAFYTALVAIDKSKGHG